nr:MATE family efflux transporter [Planctomycetota bacterium]
MRSLPALVSLIAEPLTSLVDTAFVARLGSESVAALGVGAPLLAGSYWVF